MNEQDGPDAPSGRVELDGVFRPWTPGRREHDDVDDAGGDWADPADPFTRAASETDREPGVRLRRPPSGMGRRDRREWKMLEAARVHRLRTDELRTAPDGSFRAGFISSPPKYLDRRCRKAWLAIERESSKSWWEHRRRGGDAAHRERGALAVALIAAALLGGWVIIGLFHHSAAAAAPTTTTAVSGSSTMSTDPAAAAVSTVAGVPAEAPVVSAPATRPGPAGEPGQLGTLDHGWSPTPAGGVPPITDLPKPTPINPAAVHLLAAPTGAPTAADTASPSAVVAAWAARTCPHNPAQSFAAARAAVKPLMTVSGWATDTNDPQEQGFFAYMAAQKEITRCAAITVTVSPDQPTTGGLAYVLFHGQRVVTDATPGGGRSTPVVTVMSGVRTVLRQPDGRWLVDVTAPPGG